MKHRTTSKAFLLLAALFCAAPSSWAKLQAPDYALTAQPSGTSLELTAQAPQGYHFNVKAPMFYEPEGTKERARPTSSSERQVVFNLPAQLHGTLNLFLCDDKESFCEAHRRKVQWDGKQLIAGESESGAPQAAAADAPHSTEIDADGFIVNDPDAALKLAQAQGKPLLIDFFGIWCPPCNELNAKVFPKADFRKSAQGFVKLKLDADSPVSWALKSRYKVNGYPTVVMASPDGDEISRIVGFRPRAEFVAEVKKAWAARNEPMTLLKTRADAGDQAAADKVGSILLERKEFDAAAKYLAATHEHREDLLDAQLGGLQSRIDAGDASATPELVAKYQAGIAEFPKTPESVDRRMKLASLIESDPSRKELRAKTLGEAAALAAELAGKPAALRGKDYTAADLWTEAADAYEQLGDAAKAKDAWKRSAVEYRRRLVSADERGPNIELAHSLWKSGDFVAADKLYRRMESLYPKEFTFYYGHANMKNEQGRLDEARELATQAYDFSYGDNRLRATSLLARVLKAEGKPEAGRDLIAKTLTVASIPTDPAIRTNVYVQKLKDLQAQMK